jgi:stalled ribosome alternative rescue factor ArfA
LQKVRCQQLIGPIKLSGKGEIMKKDVKKDLGEEKKFAPVPKDKESGLPKKYVAGLSKSTAKKRATHWNKMAKKSDKDPSAYKPAPGDANAKTKESEYTKKYRQMYGEEIELDEAANAGLSKKAKESGVALSTLKKVYARGVAAWNSGHRPGTTPQQWGMARVNSYITKGKTYYTADKDLREGKKKKSTVTARDYNAKAMWGRVKKQVFKAKKGRGSYVRKGKNKGIYESKVLTEGASNFSTMEHFPLLVWFDWEQKTDEWMDESRQFVEEEHADSFNDMTEDEIEELVQERFEEISDENSKDTAILSEEDFYDLESDKDEFNIKFRNTFDYESDAVTIEAGYYEGMQLFVPDAQYFKDEDKAMIEEFLYTMKEKYYLTELGGSGAYGMGYTNLGSGKGLNQIELEVEDGGDEDLEEELVPPSKEVVDSFLELLKTSGYNIDSIMPDYKELSPDGPVHIQIKSKENKFTEENFEEEYERMSDVIHEFDPTRKFHITYSFGLMNDGYATAGLDIREEWVDSKAMVNLGEASKDFSGKPSKDDLKKAAKRHKKTDKKGARGWFTVLGSGNVQNNINRFNSRVSTGSGPQTSPTTAGYVAPASSSSMAVSSTAAGGLGEAVEMGYSLTEKIEKHDVLNPTLWEGNKLKPEVKEKILDIVDFFVEGLRNDNIKILVKDIIIIGSNASYNYSDTSDVDVHLIVDTDGFNCPDELYPLLYSSYRSIFNKKYEIEFYGTGVELFVDTEGTQTISNGIYSLNTGWIKEPVQEEIPEIDMEKFDAEFSKWEDRYFELIKDEKELTVGEKPIEDVLEESVESDKIDSIDDYIEDVYDLRKISLQTEGEYSIGNLVFKEIRSLGYLDNLKILKNKITSKELSLEGLNEQKINEDKSMSSIDSKDKLNRLAKTVTEDGTYILNAKGGLEKQNLTSGFQVSFFRPEITDAEIKKILSIIGNTFGQRYLGIYQGSREISYTLESSMAKEVARIFNQESIWENEKGDFGYTENPFFDENVKVDYDKAADELLVLLGKKEG